MPDDVVAWTAGPDGQRRYVTGTLRGPINVHEHLLGLLRDGMISQGLSQRRLADQAGVQQANLSAIMSGKPAGEATWQKLYDVVYPAKEGK